MPSPPALLAEENATVGAPNARSTAIRAKLMNYLSITSYAAPADSSAVQQKASALKAIAEIPDELDDTALGQGATMAKQMAISNDDLADGFAEAMASALGNMMQGNSRVVLERRRRRQRRLKEGEVNAALESDVDDDGAARADDLVDATRSLTKSVVGSMVVGERAVDVVSPRLCARVGVAYADELEGEPFSGAGTGGHPPAGFSMPLGTLCPGASSGRRLTADTHGRGRRRRLQSADAALDV
jgi:hypothetical protein